MKQVKLVFFFIIFFSLFSKNSFSNETIAILDLDSLLEKTNSGKKIINQLNLINEQNLKSLKDIESQIKLNRDNIKNQKNILSDEQLKVKINELNNDIKQFQNEKNKLVNNFNLEKKKKLDKFFQKIIPVIENYISKNNIKVVIDKKNVFIANKKNNITEDIVKIINENFE
tara:strand:+ start:3358 stop:3870 length:513 start_codon:yes stop_codon:yes gene_type:complete